MKKVLLSLGLVVGLSAALCAAPPADKSAAPAKVEKTAAAAVPAVDDATLVKQVKEKLASTPSLKDVPINVTAKSGVVTLEGKVKNSGTKGTATRMAKSVPGVKQVNNQLEIEKAAAPAAAATEKKPKK